MSARPATSTQRQQHNLRNARQQRPAGGGAQKRWVFLLIPCFVRFSGIVAQSNTVVWLSTTACVSSTASSTACVSSVLSAASSAGVEALEEGLQLLSRKRCSSSTIPVRKTLQFWQAALKPAAVCTGLTVFDELRGIRHLESVQTDLTRTILSQPIKQARELRTVVVVPIAWWRHSPADRPRTMMLGLAPA